MPNSCKFKDDDVSFSLDEILDTSFADETSDEQNKKKHQDEQQFWSLIPIENLRQNNSSCEPEQKPSTSKVVEKCPNIDDSTLPCSICLSDMREETEDDSDVVQLSLCSHMFHRECIRVKNYFQNLFSTNYNIISGGFQS